MACVERLLPSRAQHPVEQFCTMVALSGCDFALNLPRLGPKTIWKLRHRLANLNLSQPAQLLCAMSILYWDTFVMKNAMPAGVLNTASYFEKLRESDVKEHYGAIMRRIKSSKTVSPRIAAGLWDADRAHAHTLNIEWTLAYWNLLHAFPTHTAKTTGTSATRRGVHTLRSAREACSPPRFSQRRVRSRQHVDAFFPSRVLKTYCNHAAELCRSYILTSTFARMPVDDFSDDIRSVARDRQQK